MKRVPRNYDGISMPGKTLGELLPEALIEIQKKNGEPIKDLLRAWPEIVGPNVAKLTVAVSFVDGVLTVIVKSSTLYSLLCQHERPHIMRKLQESFPKTQVRNIFFRIG